MASWPRAKAQQDWLIHPQGRWEGWMPTRTQGGDTQVSTGGVWGLVVCLLLNIKGGTCR